MKKNFKRITALAAAIILTLSFCLTGCGLLSDGTVYAKTAEGVISADGFIYDLYENGDIEIVGIEGEAPCHLTIPDTLDGHPVTSIGSGAFSDNTSIQHLTIGANVRRIKSGAFKNCSLIIAIDGGLALQTIGDSAFAFCNSLSATAPFPAVQTVDAAAFFGCTSLNAAPGAATAEYIGTQAYYGCTSIGTVYLSDAIAAMGDSVFSACTSLCRADLGGLRSVPDGTFSDCTALTAVTFNKKTEHIGSKAFGGCLKLANISVPASVSSVGVRAFYGTEWLEKHSDDFVVVGKGILIAYRGSDANVEIPANVKTVADAFSGSDTLRAVTVGGKVKKISEYAFSGCTSLGRVVIENGVTEIGEGAFSGCDGLAAVYLPSSLTAVGKNAFYGCRNLTSVNFAGSAGKWNKISFADGNGALSGVSCNTKA